MLEKAAAAKAEVTGDLSIILCVYIYTLQAVARLQQQDNELKRIRDGLVPSSKV